MGLNDPAGVTFAELQTAAANGELFIEHPDDFEKTFAELVEAGLVIDSGRRRDGQIVWLMPCSVPLDHGLDNGILAAIALGVFGREHINRLELARTGGSHFAGSDDDAVAFHLIEQSLCQAH
jgi:hypothetical protein